MQLAYELSHRSAALRFEDLPPQAVHWAKVGILDTVGVTVAGSVEPAKADSLWQLVVLQGALGQAVRADVLAYAAPTYYGMLVAEVQSAAA